MTSGSAIAVVPVAVVPVGRRRRRRLLRHLGRRAVRHSGQMFVLHHFELEPKLTAGRRSARVSHLIFLRLTGFDSNAGGKGRFRRGEKSKISRALSLTRSDQLNHKGNVGIELRPKRLLVFLLQSRFGIR